MNPKLHSTFGTPQGPAAHHRPRHPQRHLRREGIGGTLFVNWIGRGEDGKVPLKGNITIHTTGSTGEVSYSGTFAVLVSIWD